MVAVTPKGNGHRGRLMLAAAAGSILILILAAFWGGCGGSSDQGTTGSQLDDQAAGASTVSTGTVGGVGSTGGQGSVLVDYQWDQCTADMTQRYGDAETAKKVCSELQTAYPTSQKSQLATILPTVETTVGATPAPGSTIPGTGGGQTGGGSTPGTGGGTPGTGGGNGGSGSSGWDQGGIEITVPPAP
ncbi:MAG: hypothetical protein ACYC6Z_07135 [Thermoleophilia bacterium]